MVEPWPRFNSAVSGKSVKKKLLGKASFLMWYPKLGRELADMEKSLQRFQATSMGLSSKAGRVEELPLAFIEYTPPPTPNIKRSLKDFFWANAEVKHSKVMNNKGNCFMVPNKRRK